MSKNAQGYMGIQIGKLGPAVGSMWKGRNVYRGYNPFVKNPKTEKQVLQRSQFSLMNKLARALSPAINLGFSYKAKAERTTERGLFYKANHGIVHGTSPDELSISLDANVVLAEGPLANVTFGTPSYDTTTHLISVPFSDSGMGCARPDDQILVFAALADEVSLDDVDHLFLLRGSAVRSDIESIEIPVPEAVSGTTVALYGFARTTVQEATYIEDYSGFVYPNMTSPSSFIGTLPLQ